MVPSTRLLQVKPCPSPVRALESEPRHELQLTHPGKGAAEDIGYLTITRTIDTSVAGVSQVGMVESVLCLHLKFHG